LNSPYRFVAGLQSQGTRATAFLPTRHNSKLKIGISSSRLNLVTFYLKLSFP